MISPDLYKPGIFIFLGITLLYYLAFWIWLGFIATVMLAGVLWEKKPIVLLWLR
jgi:hypothetical protein